MPAHDDSLHPSHVANIRRLPRLWRDWNASSSDAAQSVTELLSQIGRGLADKWVSHVALPGLLYVLVIAVGLTLGHQQALDAGGLLAQVVEWTNVSGPIAGGGHAMQLAVVVVLAIGAGVAARTMGALVERVILAAGWRTWPQPIRILAHNLTARRRTRWDAAHRTYSVLWADAARATALGQSTDPVPRRQAVHARDGVSQERPDRPTWSGDRVHAVSVGLDRDEHLDVALVWPYVWLLLSEEQQKAISTARGQMVSAAELAAWSLLYAPLTWMWWPAGVIALILATTARWRMRGASDSYAQLVTAAVRLRVRDVAASLGLEQAGPWSPEAGDRLAELLGSSPPPVTAS